MLIFRRYATRYVTVTRNITIYQRKIVTVNVTLRYYFEPFGSM
uniref:Uncharacterized protein n=1 Tax=Myoviridae sp. ct5xZ3 TaxID=2827601 RepID=A0A8S5RRJ5_9CAUD|nr:MAG TPA: hypothetical protein [Myoviridae sp. ct5xZ3]